MSSWPFYMWGVDILGPYPLLVEQVKFLLVAVDYFTKWIEVELVATILAKRVRRFYYRRIIHRFELPTIIVSDNGTQFVSRAVAKFCSNEQAEVANRVSLRGLHKSLEEAKGRWVEELPQEEREMTHIREYAAKKDNLVLRRILKEAATNKMTPNWEGLFRVTRSIQDRIARRKIGGSHLKYNYLEEIL
ncbi:hypothetical protein CR513_30482, partial [Mucuna pruriens]